MVSNNIVRGFKARWFIKRKQSGEWRQAEAASEENIFITYEEDEHFRFQLCAIKNHIAWI